MASEQRASENLVLVYINSSRTWALVHPRKRGGERRYEEAGRRGAGASGLKFVSFSTLDPYLLDKIFWKRMCTEPTAIGV